jgi:hypothetical protein
MAALLVILVAVCVYFAVLAAICTEEEIVFSLRTTELLLLAIFVLFLVIGSTDALVRAVYARL